MFLIIIVIIHLQLDKKVEYQKKRKNTSKVYRLFAVVPVFDKYCVFYSWSSNKTC
jgi:hypothetical protein